MLARLFSCAVALALALPAPALAAGPAFVPAEPGAAPRVAIVYTAYTGGLYSSWATLNELRPLYDPKLRGDVRAEGMAWLPGVLRHGRWYLWEDATSLDAKRARALFEGDGLTLEGSGTDVPLLISDYAVVVQQPGTEQDSQWLVPFLDAKLADAGATPDVRTGRGRVFAARGSGGEPLLLLSEDGTPPPAAILRDAAAWHWVGGARTPVRRATRLSVLFSIARRIGGYGVHAEATRVRSELRALRVDAGNFIDDVNEPYGEQFLADTFAELPELGLDALVPFKYEVRLPTELAVKLSQAVPLVAANLTGPPGVRISPYVIREVSGIRVAIVGIADIVVLGQYGFLGEKTGWKGEDPQKALKRVLGEIRLDGADAVVVVTNLADERLGALRAEARGVTAIITRTRPTGEWVFRQRAEPAEPGRARWILPWLVAGANVGNFGILNLEFRRAGPARSGRPLYQLVAVTDESRTIADGDAPEPDRSWRAFELTSGLIAARGEAILPAMMRLSARDSRLIKKDGEFGDHLVVYRREDWSRLAAVALRRLTGSEAAVVYTLSPGSTVAGDIPLWNADEWLPNGQDVAVTSMSGADLERLMGFDADRSRFTTAGFDVERGLIGGRPIQAAESYRVATFNTLAFNETYQTAFRNSIQTAFELRDGRMATSRTGGSVRIRAAALAYLEGLKARHRALAAGRPGRTGPTEEFPDSYLDALAADLRDDGEAYEPRWTVAAKPCEANFQQLTVTNRDAFGEVRNSRVNTPTNTALRGRGNVAVTYETADLDWENRSLLEYQRAEFQVPGAKNVVQEPQDNVQLTSEFRLKVFKLQTPRSALELVPFVNGNYLTEFTPTDDPKTGQPNDRRQEVNGILGVVLYPGTWWKEARVGAIAKYDLVVAKGGFEPGIQLAAAFEYPLGPFTWLAEADLKNYIPTPDDTAEDLGLLGQLSTGFRFPIFGGFSLRVGVDALVFTGKLGQPPPTGTSIVPSIGLVYNATWKPHVGLVF